MSFSCRLYDVIRIDHFVGIAHYYSIPAGDPTAEHGVWITGPGEELIAAISQVMGKKRVIAEDLGIVIPQVRKIQKKSGYPGMKVLEFAFDGDSSNENLPCHYEKNCVVYGGTHDNETLAGFFPRQKRKVQQFARQYLGVNQNSQLPAAVIRAGYASAANTAIFQMQDFLELDNTARMNTPSTLGGNWRWRLLKEQLTPELAQKIKQLTILYAR